VKLLWALLAMPLCGHAADDVISLREYVDARFAAQDKAVAAALESAKEANAAALSSAERAVLKAESATEQRFANANEWRATVESLQRSYMPRTEAEQQFTRLNEKIDLNTKRVEAKDEQAKGLSQGWAILLAIVGLVVGITGMVTAFRRKPVSR
jgi:hypothetical protein